jgi:hypothetical protein
MSSIQSDTKVSVAGDLLARILENVSKSRIFKQNYYLALRQEYLNESIEPPKKSPASQLNKTRQIESCEPGEHQKREVFVSFSGEMSENPFACPF